MFEAGSIAFVHASVLEPATGALAPGRTVLVSMDRIVAVGADGAVPLPSGARSVDVAGRTLLPGLVDSHVHARRRELASYVDEGITTVRNLWGYPGLLEDAAALVSSGTVAPTVESASPGVDGPGSPWPYTQLITEPAAAEPLISQLATDGWRWVKVYSHLDAAVFEALADAADAHGIRLLGHVPFAVPLQRALDRRMLSIEHLTGYEFALGAGGGSVAARWSSVRIADMPAVSEATARAGAWNCPTLVVTRALGGTGAQADEAHRRRRLMVGALHAAGARLLAGTDSGIDATVAGSSLHDELAELVASGLSHLEALQAATSWPADALGRVGEIGTVSPGARADLMVVDGDPRQDVGLLRHPRGVLLRGAWLERP
jgi:imidazolonepropionase-like amidohydrolase